uniref:EamA domain-containing protein n=1 Tax=Rhodopseudomonas palustris (strain BisA53) TaxID=316055 RepID=Q07NP4_RHOP5
MTDRSLPGAAARAAPLGLMFLAITSIGWGLNWPVMKHILTEWPPLSARGLTGVAGALLLAALALARGESLAVPKPQRPRLLLAAFLNVTCWMTLMGLALLWLPASEAAVIAYTMPVWAALLAWLLLGERMSWMRVVALVMAFAGIAALLGGNGIAVSRDKLLGIALVLVGAFTFALGTVTSKRWPTKLPLIAGSALQIGIGCVPVALAGLIIEQPRFDALTGLGWTLMAYMTVVQFCIAYVCWFAALSRLPASVAAIGTLAVPVIGVVASAVALGEPLGPAQIAALLFTLAGVVLATRS